VNAAIVIPALNEEPTIAAVVEGAARYGQPIVVDDGSTDATSAVAEAAGAIVVRRDHNGGYDVALASGFARADALGFDAVVTMDADAQHDPAALEAMLAPLATGEADVVLGVRPRCARWAERVFTTYARVRHGIPDVLCGMKAYSMDVYRQFPDAMEGSIGTGLALAAARSGARMAFVPVPVRTRGSGRTQFGSGLRPNLRLLRAMMRQTCLSAPTSARDAG
jgi:glycosyltransferase involved in cell wall biosynthesis